MKSIKLKFIAYLKGIILLLRPDIFFGWLSRFLLMIHNTIRLSKWIATQNKQNILNDFYTAKRDYSKRYKLYQYVVDKINLRDEPIDYLEFGVSGAFSFKWWLTNCRNADNRFYGFDTFEGLPEDWGTFNKGEMSANIPNMDDSRATFVKGLFQETLHKFLLNQNLINGKRKVVHMDADLFSSTLFVLSSIAPYIGKGDILLFDEFNVPNHEFFAFRIFCDSFYIKTKLLGAVNNYYQVAMIIE